MATKQAKTAAERYAVACKLLGKRYERAELARDFPALIEAEKEARALIAQEHQVGVWSAPHFVAGRNIVRRARGLELLHV